MIDMKEKQAIEHNQCWNDRDGAGAINEKLIKIYNSYIFCMQSAHPWRSELLFLLEKPQRRHPIRSSLKILKKKKSRWKKYI